MAIEKNLKQMALKMALEKMLSEINQELNVYKNKNPNLLTYQEAVEVNTIYSQRKQEHEAKIKELDSLNKDIRSLNSENIPDYLYNKGIQLKKHIEFLRNDLEEYGRKIEITYSIEGKKYIQLGIDRDKIKRQLEILKKELEEPLSHTGDMQASEKKPSPFGLVDIKKNLLEHIIKSVEWQKEFSSKNNLDIKEDKTENKIQFSSKEKNIQIEVNKDRVSGQWKKENNQNAIPILVDLYLKAIENQKIDKHHVAGKNPEVTKLIEFELARKLKSLNLEGSEINGKKLEEILNPKSDLTNSQTIHK